MKQDGLTACFKTWGITPLGFRNFWKSAQEMDAQKSPPKCVQKSLQNKKPEKCAKSLKNWQRPQHHKKYF